MEVSSEGDACTDANRVPGEAAHDSMDWTCAPVACVMETTVGLIATSCWIGAHSTSGSSWVASSLARSRFSHGKRHLPGWNLKS